MDKHARIDRLETAAANYRDARRNLDNEIRAARADGLTLRDIGVAVRMSPQTVRNIEAQA